MADTIKILLSDLTYPRVSISPLPVPYGIGELAVYLKRQIRDNIEVDLVRTTDRFYQKIENTQYDIFGFSHYIWNAVRKNLKKRLLVVDEAWWMMKSEDTASFLYAIAKRCRKYYLGLSTITQDAADFMKSPYGVPIVTNSSIQILLKQSP